MDTINKSNYALQVFDNIDDTVLFFNDDLTLTYINNAAWDTISTMPFMEEMQIRREEIVGMNMNQVFPDVGRIRHHIDEFIKTKKTKTIEEYFVPIKTWYRSKFFATSVPNEYGVIVKSLSQMKDPTIADAPTVKDTEPSTPSTIVARLNYTEAAFYRELDYIRLVLDSAPFAVITVNQFLKIIDWNKNASKIFKFSFDQVVYRHVFKFVYEDVGTRNMSLHERVLLLVERIKAGEQINEANSSLFLHGNSTFYGVNRHESIPLEYYVITHTFQQDVYMTIYFRDLTRERETEMNLVEKDTFVKTLESIVEQSGILFYTKDLEGRYVFGNSLTFHHDPPLIGNTDRELFDYEYATIIKEHDQKVIQTGLPITVEEVINRRNKLVTYISTKLPKRNVQGSIVGIYGFSQNISEYKGALLKVADMEKATIAAKERVAVESNKLKSQFLANMSHEIRTPLSGVVGMVNLMEFTKLDQQQKEYVEALKFSADALLLIISDILDFSKIEAGKIELEQNQFNVYDLVKDLGTVYGHTARSKGLVFESNVDVPLDKAFIRADYGRLRQVVNNLLSNAVKFTQSGYVKLNCNYEVSVLQIADLNTRQIVGTLVFNIVDSGIGIRDDVKSQLFQPFTQGDLSTWKKFGGSGLGLSISKKLVDLMGGTIGLESTWNEGSTFYFKVPLVLGDKQKLIERMKTQSQAASDALPIIDTKSKMVLVAEDNIMNQRVALKFTEVIGLKGVGVENGELALELLEKAPDSFGVILMDLQMPVLNGYQTAVAIRNSKSSIRHIPIIAMTASALPEEKQAAFDSGMDDYISKPVPLEAFKSTVFKWFGKFVEHEPIVLKREHTNI